MTTGSFKTFSNDVKGYIDDNFSMAPVQYPNQPNFSKPSDSEWVRLSFSESSNSFATDFANDPRYRFPGVVMFQVFSPLGNGDTPARNVADKLVGLFRSQVIGNARFDTPSVKTVGQAQDDQSWYQLNVSCPYSRDVITFDNE